MEFNFITNVQTCFDLVRDTVNLPLVYYSHIPSALISLFIGTIVLIKNKTLLGRILFSISVVYSLWVMLSLVTWTSYNSMYYMFVWSFFGILTSLLFVLTIYFSYVFLFKKDVNVWVKWLFLIPLIPIFLLTPTTYNLPSFDGVWCLANEGSSFTTYYYAFGILALLMAPILLFKKFRQTKDKIEKREDFIFITGIGLFILMFFFTGFLASYLVDNGYITNFNLEPYGLFGMVIFMAFLAYLIVKFKTFDIKLLGTQALVWASVILIGSQFFFIRNNVNRVLTAITLIITAIIGLLIVRGIKKEIVQREKIEGLAKSLEGANNKLENVNITLQEANEKLKELDQMKSEFVSLATHQIRGPLAAIKGYISMMVEGDYGKVPKTFDEPLNTIFKSTDSLSHMVTDFLDVSRIDLGQMKYEFTDFDFRDLVNEVLKELKPSIDAKKLEFRVKITDQACLVKADRVKLKQVLNNLVDNSNQYTKTGWLEVSVEKPARTSSEKDMVLFAVKDSGVGISEKTLGKLFQRFSRAKNANDTNILGTGLGLYIAKKMVEANSGKVWAESAGEGKGAEFYVELPVK